MTTVIIDEVEYNLEELSDTAQSLISRMRELDSSISENNNMLAALAKAKNAYISDLKQEMLSAKSGFDFGLE